MGLDADFLESILDNLPAMVFVKEADRLSFVLFNRAGERLLGLPRERLMGKSDYDFFSKEQADFFTTKDRQVLASPEDLDIPEEPIHTPGGERILHTRKIAIRDRDGKPRYLLGISEDITDRKRAEQDLSELVYGAAHDLRGQLRRIAVFGDMLGADARADDRVRRMTAAARSALELLEALVKLGGLSRQTLRPEPLDVSAMARAALDELRRREPERKVEAVVAPGLGALADRAMTALLLDCLLTNAWKFTAPRVSARIEVGRGGEAPAGFERFFVRDDGVGFDGSCRGDVFQLFERRHGEVEFPGAGVGLAMVRRVATRHGGAVSIESSVGKGTTVYFTLPAATSRGP